MRLHNKVCLVTGGASGIGEATGRLFAQEGAAVAIVDVDRGRGEAVAAAIAAGGGRTAFVPADVAEETAAREAVAAVRERFGRVDVLVNNAGVSGVGDVAACEPDDWDRVMRVNVRGVYLMSHVTVPVMREQGGGVIINMSSTIALVGLEQRAAYAASKGAVLALTRAMAADHSRENIRVAAILPGTVYTPFVEGYLNRHFPDRREEIVETLKQRQLNHEFMMPEDVAHAAVYLASDEARFAIGTALVIDGGISAAKVF